MHLPRRLPLLLLIVGLMLRTASLWAADDQGKQPPPLPTDKTLWLNSSPYTWEQLRGKGVCLLFFTCDPEGTEVLPMYLESAKLHALDPVVFIGVSMGANRLKTEQYLKSTKYNWPTLCDPTNAYCRQCGTVMMLMPGDGILGTVCSSVCVTAAGKMTTGSVDDAESAVAEAIVDAKWVTNPKEVPEPLWPLWRSVEFHKYFEALPLFKKSLNNGPDSQKEAAKKLQDIVLAELDRLSGEARTTDEMDQKWAAYSKLSSIMDEFRGYDLPKDLEPLHKKLARTSQVKAGLTAEKQLTIATGNLASPMPAIRKKAQLQLEKIISDFPDTDLAEKAQKILDSRQVAPK